MLWLTDDPDKRLVLLSTLVAGATALSVPLLVGLATAGYVDLSRIPQAWFALYAGAAVAPSYGYVIGVDTYRALRERKSASSDLRSD